MTTSRAPFVGFGFSVSGTAGYLKALLIGAPNRRIELEREVEAIGPYGIVRRVRLIDVYVDEPERLDARLS